MKVDSLGSIYTEVSTKSLNLMMPPAYLVSVAMDPPPSLSSLGLKGGGNVDLSSYLNKIDSAQNLTGQHIPRNAANDGFKIRLSYAEGDSRNLTVETARAGKWRVRWVAATDDHPDLKGKSGLSANIALLGLLVKEEPEVVKGILSTEYQVTKEEHDKLLKEKAELARKLKEKRAAEELKRKKKAEEEAAKKKAKQKQTKEEKKSKEDSESTSGDATTSEEAEKKKE